METTETNLSTVFGALKYAALQHTGQVRKGRKGSPYINHLIDVLHILWDIGGVRDPEVLTAAVLHDTVEDTDTTERDIADMYGPGVASMVMEVTDDKSLPKQERKRQQVEHSAHLSPGAKLIKLADKISNVTDIIERPPAKWTNDRLREYVEWGGEVIDRLRGANDALETHFDTIAARALDTIGGH